MRHTSLSLSLLLLVAGIACAPATLSPEQRMALRQSQTRNFEVPYPSVFQAAITYLQDNEYQIRQAQKDAGLISAFKSKDVSGAEKFWGAFFVGAAAKKGDAYDVTLTMEAMDERNTRVRLNITHGQFNLAGANTDVQPVTDPMLYKSVLDALSLEVQRRNLTDGLRSGAPTAQ